MENSQEALQQAVDLIKKISGGKGSTVSEQEMARKLEISEMQLRAYLSGEAPTPAGLSLQLKSAYGVRTFVVESSTVHYVRRTQQRMNKLDHKRQQAYTNFSDAAHRESIRESLKHTVVLLRNRGLSLGVNITVKDMAGKTGISEEELYALLNDEKEMPEGDLSYSLRQAYKDLLKNIEKVEIIEDINMIKIPNILRQ